MIYRHLVRPLLFSLPPETAHHFVLRTLSSTLAVGPLRRAVANRYQSSPLGEIRRFGLSFSNPVGLAAGFDKNGYGATALAALGFGFVEVGTVTRHAQPGNPPPRLFRLPTDRALINRLGFNNDGASAVAERLAHRRPDCVLGVNIGKSRIVPLEEATDDYMVAFESVHSVADYVAVNVSSPNTPRLQELQQLGALSELLSALQNRNLELSERKRRASALPLSVSPLPLLVKISPDLTAPEIENVVEAVLHSNLAGIIATNTTTGRADLLSSSRDVDACGEGGLSGAPLRRRSTEVIAQIHRLTKGSLPIIGVGGIFTAEHAWEKISAGASLVQLYTGFIYEGPGIVKRINEGLADIVRGHGFDSLDQAIGCRAEELALA
jgi:dihydroorotate dehydrogenase